MARKAITRMLIEDVGKPVDIYSGLSAFRKEVNSLYGRRKELTKEYPNKWIAVYKGRITSVASTVDELIIKVDDAGLPRDEVVTRFLGKDKINMVL